MAYFAEIDNGIVKRVISVPDSQEHRGSDFLSKDLKLGGTWIQTSFNARIRNKYAEPGDLYNSDLDVFIEPKPYSSWILDEESLSWKAPVPYPQTENAEDQIRYEWNEDLGDWEVIE